MWYKMPMSVKVTANNMPSNDEHLNSYLFQIAVGIQCKSFDITSVNQC
jgi:hypothetical protein